MNDQDLERQVSRALHRLFPEPVDSSPPYIPSASRHSRVRVAAVAGTAAAVIGVGIAVAAVDTGRGTHRGSVPQGPSEGANSNSVSSAPPPAWAENCLPGLDLRVGPAPEYVGLTWAAAEELSAANGDSLIYFGGGGTCGTLPRIAVYGPGPENPVAVVLDQSVPEHSSPTGSIGDFTILVAERLNDSYGTRTRATP